VHDRMYFHPAGRPAFALHLQRFFLQKFADGF
jgi:hypothetical protein